MSIGTSHISSTLGKTWGKEILGRKQDAWLWGIAPGFSDKTRQRQDRDKTETRQRSDQDKTKTLTLLCN